jgi:ferredoxin-NADP reductase
MDAFAARVAESGLGNVSITEAGCMERCELGPAMVIYPDAVWYACDDDPDQKIRKPRPMELLDVVVKAVDNETDAIKSLVLTAPDGGTLPDFESGAHIDVMTSNGMRRSYSLAGDQTDTSQYLLGVLREPESRGGSTWIHDNVKAGDSLQITKPLNNFPLDMSAAKHILIAGGIGITPILSMARALSAAGADYDLHYCTRSPEETAFRDDVEAAAGTRLTYHHDGGDPPQGIRLDEVLGGEQPAGTHVYVCGPRGLIDAVRETAADWPEGCVHFELFAAAPAQDWQNEPFDIYLSRRRMDVTVTADQTILEAIRATGEFVESSCEQGLCSTCQVRVISGEVEHRDQILTDEEMAKGDTMMMCVSRGKPGEKLVLDI